MKKRNGMTLVEVIVALAIFLIMVAMVFPILLRMGLINVQSRHMMNAQEIGVLVSEDVLHEASVFKSNRTNAEKRSDFIAHLQESPMPLNSLRDTNQLFRIQDHSENTILELDYNNYKVSLEFHNNNAVRIRVVFREEIFETLIWLRFSHEG